MGNTAPYDEISSWYDESIPGGPLGIFHGFVVPEVLKLAGGVEGQQVCDLACGQGIEVSDYFSEGFWRRSKPNGVRGRIGAYHRSLNTCVNSLANAGFEIERFAEPRAAGLMADFVPVYENVPAVLISRCCKRPDGRVHDDQEAGEF